MDNDGEDQLMRKVKWGVLGTADIARGATIPGMLQAEHCELYAIAGRKAEKAADFQRTFGFQKAYSSYDELLNDPEVEAVYIPLPNDLHCEWTLKALKAGKHVLCEKPMAVSESQAAETVEDTAAEPVEEPQDHTAEEAQDAPDSPSGNVGDGDPAGSQVSEMAEEAGDASSDQSEEGSDDTEIESIIDTSWILGSKGYMDLFVSDGKTFYYIDKNDKKFFLDNYKFFSQKYESEKIKYF